MSSSQARVLPYLFAVDLVIGTGLTTASLAYFEASSFVRAAGLCASVYIVHVIMWAAYLLHLWSPIRAWEREQAESSRQRDALLAADDAIEQLPTRFTVVYALSWGLYWAGVAAFAWFWIPDVIQLGRHELVTVGFEVVASLIGASVLVFPLVRLLLLDTKAALAQQIAEHELSRNITPAPLAPRFAALALGIALAPVTWQFGTTWLIEAEAARKVAQLELRATVELAARTHNHSEVELVDALPAALAQVLEPGELLVSTVDIRLEQASAAAQTNTGSWVIARKPVEIEAKKFWLGTLGLAAAVIGWVMATAAGSVRLLSRPMQRLDAALQRIVNEGDFRAFGRLPIAYEDEVSTLARRFNKMLDLFEELAEAASAIADGDLRVEIVGKGDLQSAFSNMVEGLHLLVGKIRAAASELSERAAEIQAAAVEHELAMTQQSRGVDEASEAMERLARTANSIAASASEVLDNAEHARGHSDEVGARISEFTDNVDRVGELLELIREIADRSDLLALNGSLEATRAGEAGRGFSLVAAEMRRLAERVTLTVADVRATITNIEAASAASVAATEAGRQLTTNTSNTAARIVEVTQVQSAETELVSNSVTEVAAVISRAVATTAQTRAAAEGLRHQALTLEDMIGHFQTNPDIEAETSQPRSRRGSKV